MFKNQLYFQRALNNLRIFKAYEKLAFVDVK